MNKKILSDAEFIHKFVVGSRNKILSDKNSFPIINGFIKLQTRLWFWPTNISKQIMLVLFCVLFHSQTFAQLTGTRTIGPSGTYTSLAAAITDLNANGVGTGGVIFEFNTSNYSEVLAASTAITASGTAADTILFRPAAGITNITITGSVATALISLNACRFVIFDGRPASSGTTKQLTFINTNTTAPVFLFINGASNNRIRFTKMLSRNASVSSGAVAFVGSTGGNNNNTIDNTEISPDSPGFIANGIYSSGTASFANFNANNTISNNLIYDFFVANVATNGIFLAANNQAWTISSNKFYQTNTRLYSSATTHRVINIVGNNSNKYLITNNIIGYASSASSGTYTMSGGIAYTFIGIDIAISNTDTSNIKGNIIKNITLSTSSGAPTGVFRGIAVSSGNVNIGGDGVGESNIIGDTNTSGNINVNTTAGGAAALIAGIINTGTTGIVNIRGNLVGSMVGNGNTSVVYCLIGIQSSSSGSITKNIIGSQTVANSIQNLSSSAANAAIVMYGIFINAYTGAGNLNINDNIIANLTNGYSGTNTSAITRGIYSSGSMGGNLTINNNKIFNISTNSTSAGTGFSQAGLGGITCNNANLIGITSNEVYNLRQLGGAAVVHIIGIFPNISNANPNNVSANKVYNLSSNSGGLANIFGIRMAGSASICANNMVSLGIGTSLAHAFFGLYDLTGNTNYYYNTVFIGGNGVASGTSTFAFANDASNNRIVRNNIFMNLRSNAVSATNKHFAATFSTTGTLTSDYNIFFANGTEGIALGRGNSSGSPVLYTSFQSYRAFYAATSLEVNSAFGNPRLANPTLPVPDMSLGLASPARSSGIPVSGIILDIDSISRSLTNPNIGAYETVVSIANASTDIFCPTIAYTALSSPVALSPSRSLLSVNIKDNGTGVPVLGSNMPRIWYRNLSAGGPWQNAAGTLVGGDGNNGTWDFLIDQSILGLIAGQTVGYYVVAQDQATIPNVWYNGFDANILQADVNTQTTAPVSPNSYIISGAMAGSYTVPGQFVSITGVGGFFEAINANTIGSNITLNITANLTETGINALDNWNDGGNNYTLLIRPDIAARRNITNGTNNIASLTSMIRINAPVDMMIDGSAATINKFLYFRNTNTNAINTGGTISYSNTLGKQNTIRNCIIENNTNAATIGNIIIGTGTNNLSINNCNIGNATSGTIRATRKAIYEAAGTDNKINIQNNNIYNFEDNGIVLNSCADTARIINNRFFKNIVTTPNNTTVIDIVAKSNHIISNNMIGGRDSTGSGTYNFETNSNFIGIRIAATNDTNFISANTIKNINLSIPGASAPKFQGITIGSFSRAKIINLSIDSIAISAANGAILLEGLNLNGNSCIIRNSSFTNMSMGINNTGVLNVVNLGGITFYTLSGCSINNITGRANIPNNFSIITVPGGSNATITGNTISNIVANNTSGVRVINQTTASTSTNISRNRISRISSNAGAIYGIFALNGNINTSNNQISITNGLATNPVLIYGIYESTTSLRSGNHFFNTIHISGSQNSGGSLSFCYRRDAQNSTVNIRNNIFINDRFNTGTSTGKHYAIAANSTTSWVSNYNLLIKSTSGFIGLTGTTDRSTMADWQTGQTGQDISSWSANTTIGTSDHSNINLNNLFVNLSVANLNINTSNPECWYTNGKGIMIAGFIADYDSAAVRTTVSGFGTDLGADEFVPDSAVHPIIASVSGTISPSTTQTFTFGSRVIGRLTWGSAGTLPSSIDGAWYYSGTNPNNASATGMFNAFWRIDATGGSGYSYDIALGYDDALLGTMLPGSLATLGRVAKKSSGINTKNWLSNPSSSVNTTTKFASSLGSSFTSFSEFTVSDGSIIPLPVVLVWFKADKNDDHIRLEWQTASEHNSSHFEIERSSDGKNFDTIGRVASKSNMFASNNYAFDDFISMGQNLDAIYYRLKMLDLDGKYEYSPIRKVLFSDKKPKIIIFPNPSNGIFNIQISQKTHETIYYSLSNILGRQLGQGRLSATDMILDFSFLKTGVYWLSLQEESGVSKQKIVINK